MKKRKTSFILATALAASIIMSGCASTAVSGSDSSSTATEESATVETALDIDYSAGLKKDGHYAGVKAKNIVTLPDDYDHMTFKTETCTWKTALWIPLCCRLSRLTVNIPPWTVQRRKAIV